MSDNRITLKSCPPGLFLCGEILGFKSEYHTQNSRGEWQCDAYCVESGEYFWGGAKTVADRDHLIVKPMNPVIIHEESDA